LSYLVQVLSGSETRDWVCVAVTKTARLVAARWITSLAHTSFEAKQNQRLLSPSPFSLSQLTISGEYIQERRNVHVWLERTVELTFLQ
jgi:hypothetical protein